MNIKNFFKKRKPSLRELCIQKYGEEFGEVYDNLCCGIPVGNITETLLILKMIENVKENY